MAHRTLKRSSYENLVDRLNRFPQGAPPSQTLYKILKILISENEAGLVALLPIKPFRAPEAARRWKMTETEARKILEMLLDKYTEYGTAQFLIPDVLEVPPISEMGNVIELASRFGGAEKLREAVNDLQTLLYAA